MRPIRLALLLAACTPLALSAAALAGVAAENAQAVAASSESRASAVATGIAHLTGLAISPLLVLVTIGWTDFARAGGTSATSLPLHASPWLLVPCSLLLALTILKKCASPAIPLPLRKLLDAAEYLEAKLSALVAAGVLLPTIMATFAAASAGGAPAQAAGLAADWTNYLWIVPITIAVFASVWISFHIIDALVVLSPFALLDAALVAARATVLLVLGTALFVSPFVALVLCLPIIVLSLMFAGWCVRLDLLALCVATDLLFRRSRTVEPNSGPVRAFLASRGLGAPIRTMGHATIEGELLLFRYRPFFVLPKRTLALDRRNITLVRGVIWPTIHAGEPSRRMLSLPPRYARHARAIASRFGANETDGALLRAWNGLKDALASVLGSGSGEVDRSQSM